MDYQAQIERIKEVSLAIPVCKVSVLTGKNGSGKSLLRKLMGSRIATKLGTDEKHTVAAISMESRTNKKHDFGALNAMGIDDPTNPTSGETLHNIEGLVKSLSHGPRYLVIDEPEIGMGEEMVAALAIRLNELFNPLPKGCFGVLVITHNRYLVKHLKAKFFNLEGLTKKQWLEREILPTDIEQFKVDSLELFRAIANYKKPE